MFARSYAHICMHICTHEYAYPRGYIVASIHTVITIVTDHNWYFNVHEWSLPRNQSCQSPVVSNDCVVMGQWWMIGSWRFRQQDASLIVAGSIRDISQCVTLVCNFNFNQTLHGHYRSEWSSTWPGVKVISNGDSHYRPAAWHPHPAGEGWPRAAAQAEGDGWTESGGHGQCCHCR